MNFKTTFLALSLFAAAHNAPALSNFSIELCDSETDKELATQFLDTELKEEVYVSDALHDLVMEWVAHGEMRSVYDDRKTPLTSYIIKQSDNIVGVILTANELIRRSYYDIKYDDKGIAFKENYVEFAHEKLNYTGVLFFISDENLELEIVPTFIDSLKKDSNITFILCGATKKSYMAAGPIKSLFSTLNFKDASNSDILSYVWVNMPNLQSLLTLDSSIVPEEAKKDIQKRIDEFTCKD